MTTKDEALQMALDALEYSKSYLDELADVHGTSKKAKPGSTYWHVDRAITACREALAQKDEQSMTQDEIIRMAQEAGIGSALSHQGGELRVYIEGADWHDELKRFAKLVAAAEREACAKAVEAEAHMFATLAAAKSLSAAIRARGNT